MSAIAIRTRGRRDVLIVARHAAEHLGQAELTRDLCRVAHSFPDQPGP